MTTTQTELQQGLSLVETTLREILSSDVELLSQATRHILRAGGKRVRPRIALLAYEAVGGQDAALIVPAAVGVELIHTASLIHDDINDHSGLRRGQPTVNLQWGNGLALLVGDFVFIKLLKLLTSCDRQAVEILAQACAALVEGETLQMLAAGNLAVTEEQYLAIVGRKTAALFAASTELGGIIGAGSPQQVAALKEYGFHFGLAYQIQDDTLDLVGQADTLGKPVASDLLQGKISLAVIQAMRQSQKAAVAVHAHDAEALRAILRDTGAIDYAMRRAGEHAARAKAALAVLPLSSAREQLDTLADLAFRRDR